MSYEWCLTDAYDANNPIHVKSKKQIEEGDGLPDLVHTSECDKALKRVGFEIVECYDKAGDDIPGGEPWYVILTPSFIHFFRFQFTAIGTFLVDIFMTIMELIRLAPSGSGKVREMLRQGQLGLVTGGELGTFTPMYFVFGQKPLSSD